MSTIDVILATAAGPEDFDDVSGVSSELIKRIAVYVGYGPLLGLNNTWRQATLVLVKNLCLRFGAPLHVALRAAAARRANLQILEASGCGELCSDAALSELAAVLRGRHPPAIPSFANQQISKEGEVPLIHSGNGPLRHLRLAGVQGLGRPSCRTLKRLGLSYWAFPAKASAQGTLLLSRPMLPCKGPWLSQESCMQPHLVRSVILVLEHGSEGSVGLVLNKPSTLLLGEEPWQSEPPWSPQLDDCTIYFGGDTGGHLCLLHTHPDLGGEEIVDGLYISIKPNVFEHARRLVAHRLLQRSSLRWVQGSCRWGPGELSAEIQRGRFHPIFCDRSFLLPDPNDQSWVEPSSDDLWAELQSLTSL
eukprot:TRINITY_DN43944_c0_g1_i1.p1 TRINITY_DN43944_c0_g1~~TRINITY_DN43944_c0_g1_i1.p1  ORF type:complete len:362 (-),score=30.91 TRINITY_DN43944_c0_g1_i1:41-1126(-)